MLVFIFVFFISFIFFMFFKYANYQNSESVERELLYVRMMVLEQSKEEGHFSGDVIPMY